MKSYYRLIDKTAREFTAKNHFAPSVIYMTEEFYLGLLHEIYGNAWWILVHCHRISGLKIIFDNEVEDFLIK